MEAIEMEIQTDLIEGWTFRKIGVDGYSWIEPSYWFVKNPESFEHYSSSKKEDSHLYSGSTIICVKIKGNGWLVTNPEVRMSISEGWNPSEKKFDERYKDVVAALPIHSGPKQAIIAYTVLTSALSSSTFWKRQAELLRAIPRNRYGFDGRVDKILLGSSERGLPDS